MYGVAVYVGTSVVDMFMAPSLLVLVKSEKYVFKISYDFGLTKLLYI